MGKTNKKKKNGVDNKMAALHPIGPLGLPAGSPGVRSSALRTLHWPPSWFLTLLPHTLLSLFPSPRGPFKDIIPKENTQPLSDANTPRLRVPLWHLQGRKRNQPSDSCCGGGDVHNFFPLISGGGGGREVDEEEWSAASPGRALPLTSDPLLLQ